MKLSFTSYGLGGLDLKVCNEEDVPERFEVDIRSFFFRFFPVSVTKSGGLFFLLFFFFAFWFGAGSSLASLSSLQARKGEERGTHSITHSESWQKAQPSHIYHAAEHRHHLFNEQQTA